MVIISEQVKLKERGLFQVLCNLIDANVLRREDSMYNVFDIYRPDILFCLSNELNQTDHGELIEKSATKIVLIGESTNLIKPSLLCRRTDMPFGNIPCLSIKSYINPYTDLGKKCDYLECDVAYAHLGQNLTEAQLNWLFSLLDTDLRYRAYWIYHKNLPNSVGKANVPDIIKSAKCVLDIDGSLLLLAALNKTPCVSFVPNKFGEKTLADIPNIITEPDQEQITTNYNRALYNTAFKLAKKIFEQIDENGRIKEVEYMEDKWLESISGQ